jgi:hypothetical protein
MNNKLTPYNTGKVQIGAQYVPPKPDYMDHDAEHWQNVLTGVYQYRRKTRTQFILYVVGLVIIFSVIGVLA